MQHTDIQLILRWQQGEIKAFDAIYHRYFIILVNIAWKKTGDALLAQELAQDVFISLYKNRDQLHTETRLDGYLFIALRNKIYNHHRQWLTRQKHEGAVMQMQPVSANTVSEAMEEKELYSLVQEKLDDLPPRCKDVFLLSRRDQLSHKEISERLNISVNTVDQHIQKALRLLREGLTEYQQSIISLIAIFLLTVI